MDKIPGTPEQLQHRRQLVDALRSGKYTQTRGFLKLLAPTEEGTVGEGETIGGMCCLGVACDISGLGKWETRDNRGAVFVVNGTDFDSEYLPGAVQEWVGFHSRGNFNGTIYNGSQGMNELSELNDAGWTFTQIADFIEKSWEVANAQLA